MTLQKIITSIWHEIKYQPMEEQTIDKLQITLVERITLAIGDSIPVTVNLKIGDYKSIEIQQIKIGKLIVVGVDDNDLILEENNNE